MTGKTRRGEKTEGKKAHHPEITIFFVIKNCCKSKTCERKYQTYTSIYSLVILIKTTKTLKQH